MMTWLQLIWRGPGSNPLTSGHTSGVPTVRVPIGQKVGCRGRYFEGKIELLNHTNMVDYFMDIHKSFCRSDDVHHCSDDPCLRKTLLFYFCCHGFSLKNKNFECCYDDRFVEHWVVRCNGCLLF